MVKAIPRPFLYDPISVEKIFAETGPFWCDRRRCCGAIDNGSACG